MVDASGQSMGRSIGQRYMLLELEVLALYTGSHVTGGLAGVRHACLACLGGDTKPEAATAWPRLLCY